jgi:hypothetical protein
LTLLKIIYAFFLPTLCGFLLVSLAPSRRSLAGLIERLSLGFGAGIGILTLEIFLLGVAGIPFSASIVSLSLGVTAGILALIRYLLPPAAPAHPAPPGVEADSLLEDRTEGGRGSFGNVLIALLLLWIAFKTIFVLYEGFSRPVVLSLDAWWNWGSGAKVFYYNRGLLLDPADEHFFGRGYRQFLGYPLLNPLTQVWFSLVNGSFHESLSKSWSPVYFVSMLSVFYFTLRSEAGRVPSLVATFFLSSAPLLTYHATDGYSDLPLAFYLLTGSVLLYRYFKSGSLREAALSGLLLSMGAFTKNEGSVFLFAGFIALLAHNLLEKRLDLKGIIFFVVPAAVYIAPWLLFKAWYGIGYGHGFGTGVGAADEAGGIKWTDKVHYEVLPIFFKELLLTVNHAMVFPFLIIMTILGLRSIVRTKIKYLYLMVLLILAAFLIVYTNTHDYKYIFNRAAANRNILTFVPLTFLVASLTAVKVLLRDGGRGGGKDRA